ncbi:MAG: polysaccharide biosynthesis/export family protein [Bacteroidales bacterium]|nr:polysaccharide biosynthesis/export family protein [Bacteroidales bacterium]
MKIDHTITLISLSIILILSSCVTRKKLTYLKYSDKLADYNIPVSDIRTSVTPAAYKVMPYDNLYIRVITPDPEWSSLFNIMPVGAGGAVTEESAALFGYPVDGDGNIDIPFVGKVEAGGKTLSEIKVELDSIFKNYVADAAITVRLVNNYVSIIGEVRSPGRYLLTKDRVNVFEALSMAGDMSQFSNRQKVQLIRPSPYGPVIKEFSLADRSILSSELYYIMPNDIIYSMPMQGRSFAVNSSVWTLFLSAITSALGVIAFFRTL